MATTPAPTPRAHLLSGLRTGGVRSASMGNAPHTAGPAGSFAVPRFVSSQNNALFPPEEEDELSNMAPQSLYINNNRHHQPAMTAAVDGVGNRFSMQQSMGANNGMGYNPLTPAAAQNQLQALQLQMMQMEITRLQTIQAQQYQAELLAQATQAQRMHQQTARRSTAGFVPPATAGPTHVSFDLRTAAANAQTRRSNQAEQLRARLGVSSDEQIPMTAALGGKFGSRVTSAHLEGDDEEYSRPPSTPNYTTVISGGTSLGNLTSNNHNNGMSTGVTSSKSDAAVSWRRGGANNSVLSGNRAASSPLVKITPPPVDSTPPSLGSANMFTRARPSPLQLGAAASKPMADTVAIDATDSTDADDTSSVSSRSNSNSSPSTPNTADSNGEIPRPPLSPREEAETQAVVQKLTSYPMRQPLGPPSNNDELLPKNFASRSRRQAIGALMGARERREVVEAF
ncbi:hypothetical protein B0H21DRAFT_818221 [Amylocystis lapponica]|nr:hypothetical protein B0H21DRAFT_818221 [Amylocystis lapponica]